MPEGKTLTTSEVEASLGLAKRTGLARIRPWWWLALLLLALAAWWFWQSRQTDDTVHYQTQVVQRGDLTVVVTATGNLEPTNQVDIGTEVSGTIAQVEVDYNDQVEVDQVLVRLDTSKLEAQLLQARAALDSAQARVRQAQATIVEASNDLRRLRRAYQLSGGKTPSESELDSAQATLARAEADEAIAKASVSEAQASLVIHETDLKKAIVRSPINGVVLQRNVDPGQTVAASLQAPVLFTLAEDLTKMELHVFVDEADVGQVRAGQEATFTVDAYPERAFPAHIIQVRYGSQEVDGVITYETVLQVDNSDLSLRPGMTATAEIVVNRVEDAILIPNAALRFAPPVQEESSAGGGGLLSRLLPRPPRITAGRREDAANGKSQIWILQADQPVALTLSTGASDGIWTVVSAGDLQPGTPVIIDMLAASD